MTSSDFGYPQIHILNSPFQSFKDALKLQLNRQRDWKLTCSDCIQTCRINKSKHRKWILSVKLTIKEFCTVCAGIMHWLSKERGSKHLDGTSFTISMTAIGIRLTISCKSTSPILKKWNLAKLPWWVSNPKWSNNRLGRQSGIWFQKLLMVEESQTNGTEDFWTFMLWNILIS